MAQTPTYRRILWPTDFSPVAEAALPYAVDLAARDGAELVLLHVLTPAASYAVAEVPGDLWVQIQKRNWAAAREQLRSLAKRVKSPKVRAHTMVVEGVATEQILRVAKRLRCNLIVLATHGRTGLGHVFIGSVAENVVRRASCPVLTIRPPKFKA